MSIKDKEVFDFRMVNHVDATEGDAYTDMHIVDTSVTLTVGCIQVIFLNKFVSSILVSIISCNTASTILLIQRKLVEKNTDNNTDTNNNSSYFILSLFNLMFKFYLAPITYTFKKRRGPRTEPWGTPYSFLMETICCLASECCFSLLTL